MRITRVVPVVVATAAFAVAGLAAKQGPPPEAPGVYLETERGPVHLTKTFSSVEIAGPMSGGARSRAAIFPIPSLDGVPTSPGVTAFLVNLPTVQDHEAAGAQLRFAIGERVREPDYQVMTVQPGKFRIGMYRITSPNLTHDWLSAAYAKLTSSRKWKDKRPPAIVGLILNGEMYPVRIDAAWLEQR